MTTWWPLVVSIKYFMSSGSFQGRSLFFPMTRFCATAAINEMIMVKIYSLQDTLVLSFCAFLLAEIRQWKSNHPLFLPGDRFCYRLSIGPYCYQFEVAYCVQIL